MIGTVVMLLRYRYRGTDPNHPDNVGLLEVMRHRLPLVYFHGSIEGKYEADSPTFILETHQSL
jgi:putative restriction endonuclease